MNPLRVSSLFKFHAANTASCGVAAIVLSQWQCSFFDRLRCINGYSKKTKQKNTKNKQTKTAGTETCVQDGPVLPLGRVALHVLHWRFRAKSERNKTRLASNRGSLGVLWTYSGSVVVLYWDLTHNENTQTSTLTHACRVTLTRRSSLNTNTRGSPRTRIKHTLLHKDINLTKTDL